MLSIQPIPAFDDNHIWLLYDEPSLQAQGRYQGESAPEVFATMRGWKGSF